MVEHSKREAKRSKALREIIVMKEGIIVRHKLIKIK